MKVKFRLKDKIAWLFSPCRRCKDGFDYSCIYCPHREEGKKWQETISVRAIQLLKKEWLKNAFEKYKKVEDVRYLDISLIKEYEAYLDGLHEMQKENNRLAQHILELQKDKGELADKVKELQDHPAEEVELHLHAEEYIKSLEKENAELKNKLTEKVTLESLDVVSAKMNDLEKENAELKHNKKTVVHLADCLEEKMKERIEELEQQIEKMKCCANCVRYFADCKMEDIAEEEYLRANAFCKHWELKE